MRQFLFDSVAGGKIAEAARPLQTRRFQISFIVSVASRQPFYTILITFESSGPVSHLRETGLSHHHARVDQGATNKKIRLLPNYPH